MGVVVENETCNELGDCDGHDARGISVGCPVRERVVVENCTVSPARDVTMIVFVAIVLVVQFLRVWGL